MNMSLICLAQVSRPSSLPLPRSVPELLPPPHVPKELNTPSPTTRKHSSAQSFHPTQPHGNKLRSKLATGIPFPSQTDVRCGSLSPAVPGRSCMARASVKNKNVPPDKNRPSKPIQLQNFKTMDTNNGNNNIKGDSKGDASSVRKSISMTTKKNSVTRSAKIINKQPIQQPNQTNFVQSKKPPPLRDQNRAPGHTFRREEGKSVSAQGVGPPNQSNLVKVSSPRTSQHSETIAKLKNANDQISRQLRDVKLASKANAKGFDALAIVVGYLAPEALSAAELRKTISKLQMDISKHKLMAGDLQGKMETQMEIMKQRDNEWKKEKQYMELHQKEKFDYVLKKHEEELKLFRSKIALNEELVHGKHEEHILELGRRHEEELKNATTQHNKIVFELEANIARIKEEKKKDWVEERMRQEEQISVLKEEIKGLQENMLKDSDFRLQVAHTKNINLLQEIDSLKTVVDMRTAEVHELRDERSRLEEKVELFDTTKENLKKMIAQVEDLREQINAKSDVERKVSEENRALHLSLEKETSEKKRLSMENEQLFYKTCQATKTYYMHSSEGSMEGPLTYSSCKGTYNSLPNTISPANFSGANRPVSAPPGKPNIALSPRSLLTEDDGSLSLDSPRVREIIEKNKSVSWKLEYEMDMVGANTTFKRKLSPSTSHMASKFRGRGGSLSRSLNMNEFTKTLGRSVSLTPEILERSEMLVPQSFILQRSKSMRKKIIIPNYETPSESSESVGDETSPAILELPMQDVERNLMPPAPVKIAGNSDDEIFGDISSSSEIDIGEESFTFLESIAKSTPESVLALQLSTSTSSAESVGGGCNRLMSTSLPSYDLANLFYYSPSIPKHAAGESLIECSNLPPIDCIHESSQSDISEEK